MIAHTGKLNKNAHPNSKKFKIDYTPKFEILTLDEFFTGIDPLFS